VLLPGQRTDQPYQELALGLNAIEDDDFENW